MKAAADAPRYHDAQDFALPPGIVTATVDLHTNPGTTGDSVVTRTEYFIEGTEPQPASGGVAGVLSKIFHLGRAPKPPAAAVASPGAVPRAPRPAAPARNAKPAPPAGVAGGDDSAAAPDSQTGQKPRAKKGVFRKFLSVFRGGDRKKQ